jgi:ribonuclease P/MRP protein subunit RPP40
MESVAFPEYLGNKTRVYAGVSALDSRAEEEEKGGAPGVRRLVLEHALNARYSLVELGVRGAETQAESPLDQGCDWFYYQLEMPLRDILHKSILGTLIRDAPEGRDFVLVCRGGRQDRRNTCCVSPDGVLRMTLDRETYQQLGLMGRKSRFRDKRDELFHVTVNLRAPGFHQDKKMYERVSWALNERVGEECTDMIVGFYSKQGSLEIEFPPSATNVKLIRTRKPILSSSSPCVEKCRPAICAPELAQLMDLCTSGKADDDAQLLSELSEWVGLVSCRMYDSLVPPSSSSSSSVPESTDDMSGYVSSLDPLSVWQTAAATVDAEAVHGGLISANQIWNELRAAAVRVAASKASLVLVTVHGFVDAPQSWNNKEHGIWMGAGENDYSVLLLPAAAQERSGDATCFSYIVLQHTAKLDN